MKVHIDMADPPRMKMAAIRVWAKNDAVRKILRHPIGGAFPADPEQGALWPNDQFTLRLLRDGDVMTRGPALNEDEVDKAKEK